MSAPLYERLLSYAAQNRISFAMPGHKNGRGLNKNLMSLDVTELESTENLHHCGRYVHEARELLSHLYGSDKSYILTGGSTAAIQSMICAGVRSGGTLLAGSDCHMSVINTCSLVGINIKFFPKDINDFSVPDGIGTLKQYLTDDIDAVIVTSPNYYGICSDIKKIAWECHNRNIPLLVDEAHGAHFVSDSRFPETAVKYADAVCHSAHKTLNAMNGAAYLHVNGTLVNSDRLEKALCMFQSSSPSYVIAASADIAREELERKNMWDRTIKLCMIFRERMKKMAMRVLDNDDVTRIVLNFSDYNISALEIERILSKNGIDIEMADLFNIVLIVTPSNTENDIEVFCNVIADVIKNIPKAKIKREIVMPPYCGEILSPRKAFFAENEKVLLPEALGRVSCGTVVPYPPGIPVIYTGETIKKEHIEYIEKIQRVGGEITGIDEGVITAVKTFE